MGQVEKRPSVQELRTPEGQLLGKVKRGRWLEIQRGGTRHAFDLRGLVEPSKAGHAGTDDALEEDDNAD